MHGCLMVLNLVKTSTDWFMPGITISGLRLCARWNLCLQMFSKGDELQVGAWADRWDWLIKHQCAFRIWWQTFFYLVVIPSVYILLRLFLTVKPVNAPQFAYSVLREVCHDEIWHRMEARIAEWKIWCPAMLHHAKQALTMYNTSMHLTDKAFYCFLQDYKPSFNSYLNIFLRQLVLPSLDNLIKNAIPQIEKTVDLNIFHICVSDGCLN